MHPFLATHLISPKGNPLTIAERELRDTVTGESYPINDGIPDLRPMLPANSVSFDYQSHYQIDAEEFDYFEENSGETAHEERRLREQVVRLMDKALASVLDAGCGDAWLAAHFEKTSPGTNFVSMDISTPNPKEALRRHPFAGHSALVADAYHLPFTENTFDLVVASEVIEHVIDPERFVHSLVRVLKPGGKLIISTPYKERLRYALCIHCNQKTPMNAHIHSFDEKKLAGYAPPATAVRQHIFGNKALFHLRTHVALRYLPFTLWKMLDASMNRIIDKRGHIVVEYVKR